MCDCTIIKRKITLAINADLLNNNIALLVQLKYFAWIRNVSNLVQLYGNRLVCTMLSITIIE